MVNPRVEENKLGKYLVFDERVTSLKNILDAAKDYFPDVDHNELFFDMPDYGSGFYDIFLSRLPKTHFIKYEDGDVGAKIYGHRTLAQIIREAKNSPECRSDLSNVRLFWHHGELCMHITVDKTEPVICDTISAP